MSYSAGSYWKFQYLLRNTAPGSKVRPVRDPDGADSGRYVRLWVFRTLNPNH